MDPVGRLTPLIKAVKAAPELEEQIAKLISVRLLLKSQVFVGISTISY
jgi:hypothetical protein